MPLPAPQTTVVAEEIWMSFVANKSEHEKGQEVGPLPLLSALSTLSTPNVSPDHCLL